MVFAIDIHTRVIGHGVGAKAAAQGGRVPIGELVASGDRVNVSYHDLNGKMHASRVQVTGKPKAGTN